MLKPNSQSGRQDLPDQEARTSSDHQSASGSCGETHSNNIDYRIPGIPHSTVQHQDTNCRETIKKLIQQFENHPNKESFLQDLNQTEEINVFSKRSKKLINDVGSTEIFELCETSLHDTMAQLSFILATWHRVLFMWKKSQPLAKDQTVRQEELRRLISSLLRHQKEPHPWCYSWNFRTATNVL